MPRRSRVVFSHIPHHITQRGSRRQDVFFEPEDRMYYLKLLGHYAKKFEVSILAYCLMTNHVHHILVPSTQDGLHRLCKTVHAKYALVINKRHNWTGHLWQARFFSSPLDENYLLKALRYVELNPVRAGMVREPHEYCWSSARSHILRIPDPILDVSCEWNSCLPDSSEWNRFLQEADLEGGDAIRQRNSQNLPCGSQQFLAKLQQVCGIDLAFRPRGRPRKR